MKFIADQDQILLRLVKNHIIKRADDIAMKKVNMLESEHKPPLQAVPGYAPNRGSNVYAPDGSQHWINASLGSHNRTTTMSYPGKGWYCPDQMSPMSGPFPGSSDLLSLKDPWQREVEERNQSGAAVVNWNKLCGPCGYGPPNYTNAADLMGKG